MLTSSSAVAVHSGQAELAHWVAYGAPKSPPNPPNSPFTPLGGIYIERGGERACRAHGNKRYIRNSPFIRSGRVGIPGCVWCPRIQFGYRSRSARNSMGL